MTSRVQADGRRADCAAALATVVAPIREAVDAVATELRDIFAAPGPQAVVSVREIQELRPVIVGKLTEQAALVDGTGVVMAPGTLSDRLHYLEWWRTPGPRRLTVDLNPASDTFYDYTQMEWFSDPRDSGQAGAYGPWVDYSGAEQYVITFSQPVFDATGRFLGIAGADVPLTNVESAVLPELRATGLPLVLVNDRNRVVSSNSPEASPGVLLREGRDERSTPVPPFGRGWRLVSL